MQRRLTTILAADLAGYSRLMAADEEGTIRRLHAVRAEVIDPAIDRAGGRIVKTMGDGLLVEFPSPVEAVRCALAAQAAMAARETGPEEARLRFRVGINLGDIVEDGADILGDGVNIAARLESLAPPGGICISGAVHEQVRDRIAAAMIALGPQQVKNIPRPVEVWRIEVDGAAPGAVRAAGERASVAVLPFDNLSADPDQDFLADGIVEDVLTELSRFRDIAVIARNSSFAYRGCANDIRRVGRELGARYVVEGSVRRAGDRLRVTVQLIEAETGAHVLAERFDRKVADLFEVQDEVTRAIIAAIAPGIGAHERQLARRKPPASLTAWELTQRALSEYLTFSAEGLAAARRLCAAAIAAAPDMAMPHAVLARTFTYAVTAGRSADPPGDLARGAAHARDALARDADCDFALSSLSAAHLLSGRPREALDTAERALSINPSDATTWFRVAMSRLHPSIADAAGARTAAENAIRLSPRDPLLWAFRAMPIIATCLEAAPGWEARALAETGVAAASANEDAIGMICRTALHFRLGRDEEARAILAEALRRNPALTAARARIALPQWFGQPGWMGDHSPLIALGLPEG